MPRPEQPRLGAIRSEWRHYEFTLAATVEILDASRRASARAVNSLMTSAYWQIGRHIVEFEQGGVARAAYGHALVRRLARDLSASHGRGFSHRNLWSMRSFYLRWPMVQTASAPLDSEAGPPSIGGEEAPTLPTARPPSFALPWSHYVRLLRVVDIEACNFYETEALRGGWTIRQLERQIGSQFFERTRLARRARPTPSRAKAPVQADVVAPSEAVKDPLVLEFLDLKDEYSESDLEAALIGRLQDALLELGGSFAFVGRQKRLRIDDVWFRVDLLMYHRRLRCLVIIDLKAGEFSHADVGQMNVYVNYAAEHWTLPGENPPVGLILCASKRRTLARYALEGLRNTVLASEYRTELPKERLLARRLEQARRLLGPGRAPLTPPGRRRSCPEP